MTLLPLRRLAPCAAGLAVALAGARPAGADPTAGVDSILVRPAFDSNGGLTLESAKPLARHDLSFKLVLGYSQKPLAVAVPGIGDGAMNTSADPVLGFALAGDMSVAFALTAKLTVGLDVGFYRTDVDEGYGERGRYSDAGSTPSTGILSLRPLSNLDPQGDLEAEQKAGPLDTRIGFKYAFKRGRGLAAAAIVSVSAPFGDEEMMLGDANLVFEPRLAIDYGLNQSGTSRILFNAGARIRQRTVLEAYDPDAGMASDALAVLDIGSEGVLGAGIIYELLPQLVVDVEAMYLQPLPEFFDYGKCRTHSGTKCFKLEDDDYFGDAKRGDPAALALAGVSYRATPDVSLALGGGLGVLGARKEDFRLMSGVVWQPSPAGSRVIGRGDTDGDGLGDSIDICVDEPEDQDDFQDDDGCPDLDNDGDGIIDASDGCTDEPEDKDGYQDDDGCPERDNDGDKVEDVVDRCPLDKEDMDSYEDDDGCPDEDNDGDGFPDGKDKCPNERETPNGIDDTDGCPDSRTGGPQMDTDSIDLQGSRIAFTGAKKDQLSKASQTLLDQVAELLRDPKNTGKTISIESHVALSTASTNANQVRQARARDLDLSRRRAKVVQDYLIGKGVRPDILRPNALGSTTPLRQPPTDPINDRIEFSRL